MGIFRALRRLFSPPGPDAVAREVIIAEAEDAARIAAKDRYNAVSSGFLDKGERKRMSAAFRLADLAPDAPPQDVVAFIETHVAEAPVFHDEKSGDPAPLTIH